MAVSRQAQGSGDKSRALAVNALVSELAEEHRRLQQQSAAFLECSADNEARQQALVAEVRQMKEEWTSFNAEKGLLVQEREALELRYSSLHAEHGALSAAHTVLHEENRDCTSRYNESRQEVEVAGVETSELTELLATIGKTRQQRENVSECIDRMRPTESRRTAEEVARRLAEAEQRGDELSETLARQDREYTATKAGLEDELATTKAALEHELATTKATAEHELATTKGALEHELATTKGALEHELATTKGALEHELATTKATLEHELAATKAAKEEELASTKAALEDELGTTKAALEKELAATRAAKEEELANTRALKESELATTKAALEQELVATKEALESALTESRRQYNEVTQRLAESEKREKEVARRLEEREAELADVSRLLEKREAELNQQIQIERQAAELAALKSVVEASLTDGRQAHAEVLQAVEKRCEAEQHTLQLTRQVESQRQELEAGEKQAHKLNQHIEKQRQEMEDLENQVRERDAAKASLEETLADERKAHAEDVQKEQEARGQIEQLELQLRNLEDVRKGLDVSRTEALAQLTTVQSDVLRLTPENAQLKEESGQLKEENTRLKEENALMKEELEALARRLAALEPPPQAAQKDGEAEAAPKTGEHRALVERLEERVRALETEKAHPPKAGMDISVELANKDHKSLSTSLGAPEDSPERNRSGQAMQLNSNISLMPPEFSKPPSPQEQRGRVHTASSVSALRDSSPRTTCNSLGPGPTRALSAEFLSRNFLQEVAEGGLGRESTLREVETLVLQPNNKRQDGSAEVAYVDCERCQSHVGQATVALCCSGRNTIGDIVDGVVEYCSNENLSLERTYIWIRCLCISKQRGKHMGPAQTKDHLQEIGSMLVLWAPFDQPQLLSSVQCMLELYTAVALKDACNVHFIVPPVEWGKLRRALVQDDGITEMWDTLASANMEQAAEVEKDEAGLLALVQGYGTDRINHAAAHCLQERLVHWGRSHLQQMSDDFFASSVAGQSSAAGKERLAVTCGSVGRLLCLSGEAEEALQVLERGRNLQESIGNAESLHVAVLHRYYGVAKHSVQDYEGALESYEKARRIRDRTGTLQTEEGSKLLESIGASKYASNDLGGAVEAFEAARYCREAAGSLKTTEGAHLLMALGSARIALEDWAGAQVALDQAKLIYERENLMETSHAVHLMEYIGTARSAAGDLKEALAALENARQIRAKEGMLETLEGSNLLVNIGALKMQKSIMDVPGAVSTLEVAKRVFQVTGTLETLDGANLLTNLGIARLSNGEHDSAQDSFVLALQIYRDLGALETPDALNLSKWIEFAAKALQSNAPGAPGG